MEGCVKPRQVDIFEVQLNCVDDLEFPGMWNDHSVPYEIARNASGFDISIKRTSFHNVVFN